MPFIKRSSQAFLGAYRLKPNKALSAKEIYNPTRLRVQRQKGQRELHPAARRRSRSLSDWGWEMREFHAGGMFVFQSQR